MHDRSYVLITAAKNEQEYIEHTIRSVVAQRRRPEKWVIVSDASTDRTDAIVQEYARRHPFIHYHRTQGGRNGFASKVYAFRSGWEIAKEVPHRYLGNLDADVTFPPHYYEHLLELFESRRRLGIAGGSLYDLGQERVRNAPYEGLGYVPGAVQLFRRACFEEIGGYPPMPTGGEDTVAVVRARMKGWEVEAVPELHVLHHKVGSSVRGACRESWRNGGMNYALGSHPLLQILKGLRRIPQKPYLLAACANVAGFLWPYCTLQKRTVDEEFVRHFRREQMSKVRSLLQRRSRCGSSPASARQGQS